jgi:hypothetical protein
MHNLRAPRTLVKMCPHRCGHGRRQLPGQEISPIFVPIFVPILVPILV